MHWLLRLFASWWHWLIACGLLTVYLTATIMWSLNAFGGVIIPISLKAFPLGIFFLTIDVMTKHEYCQFIRYGENRWVTSGMWACYGMLLWAVWLFGYSSAQREKES